MTSPTPSARADPRRTAVAAQTRWFFGLALGWSALWWTAAACTGRSVGESPTSLLFYLGGAGPPVAAIVLTHLRETRAATRDFWLRVIDPRRIGGRWLAAALLVHPALVGAAVVLDAASGTASTRLAQDAASAARPLELFGVVFFVFWFGPLPEEIGWRGYALDRLQTRLDALRASLVLGVAWALWHLPLFFIEDTFQRSLGVATLRFWLFLASLMPLSVLITWVYNHTRRSTLAAVLFHFSGNLSGVFLDKSPRLMVFEFVLLTAAAIAVTLVFGHHRLVRETPRCEP